MKKIILLILAVILLLSIALPLSSCSQEVPEVPYTTVTRITVDALASVEVIVNFQNSVVAVTPLNDAAKVILAGEAMLKTTPEVAVGRIVELCAKAGYLSAVDSVKISVSGKGTSAEVDEYVDVITDMIEDEAKNAIEESGSDISLEFTEPATVAELRDMNRAVGYYSEEILSSIPNSDLIFAMAQCRVAAASLPGLEFSYAYFSGMDRSSLIFNKNGIADVIKNMGETQAETYSVYRAAVDKYIEAANAVDKFIHDSYLAPESDYQKLSAAVRSTLANIENGRDAYDKAVAALDAEKAALAKEITPYIDAFKEEADNLTSLERDFNKEIMTEYRAKAVDIFNASLEDEKTFLSTFTEKYSASIEAAKASIGAK